MYTYIKYVVSRWRPHDLVRGRVMYYFEIYLILVLKTYVAVDFVNYKVNFWTSCS